MRRSMAGLSQSAVRWQTCRASCRRSCWHSLHPGPSSVLVEVPGAQASGVSGRDPHLNRPLAGHVAQAMNRSAVADIHGNRPRVGRRVPSAPRCRRPSRSVLTDRSPLSFSLKPSLVRATCTGPHLQPRVCHPGRHGLSTAVLRCPATVDETAARINCASTVLVRQGAGHEIA